MKYIFFVILICLGVSNASLAQNYDEFREKQVGASISSLSGMSLYYIQDLTYEDNLKVTFLLLPSWDEEDEYWVEDEDQETLFSFGLEYQRDVLESKRLRFHFLTGVNVNNTLFVFDECLDSAANCYYTNAGLGAGFDIEIAKGFVFNIHSMYQVTRSHGDFVERYHGFGGGVGISLHFAQN